MSRHSQRWLCRVVVLAAFSVILARPAVGQVTGGGGGGGGGTGGGQGGQPGGQTGNSGGGILVDAAGLVRPMFQQDPGGRLDRKRREELAGRELPADLNRASKLRKISLVALEAACDRRLAEGQPLPPDIQYLAGLQRIDYLFADPEHQDLVIAGPAEGFVVTPGGRSQAIATGLPALRLENLLVVLRSAFRRGAGSAIRCSIDPNPAHLAKFQESLSRGSNGGTVDEVAAQFRELTDVLGEQDVSVSGIPDDSQLAELLVEADIRMKYLAVGRDKAPVAGFRSHLSMVPAGGNSMQRWWFAPLYEAIIRTHDGLGYEFRGQRLQLLSEDELLSESGQRTSAPFTRVTTQKFSRQFTDRFPELARTIPVFAELQGAVDLAVLAAILRRDDLPAAVNWRMGVFLDEQRAQISRRNVPRHTPSVSNFRQMNKGVLVMQVTGGVLIDPRTILGGDAVRGDPQGQVQSTRQASRVRPAGDRWWWD